MTTTTDIKTLIANMTPEQKAANVNSLTYIKTLASSANANIINWDLLSIFSQTDGFNLITDKKELNKKFFEHLEKVKSAAKQAKEVINANEEVAVQQPRTLEVEEIKNAFLKIAKKARDTEVATLRGLLAGYEREMNDYSLRLSHSSKNFQNTSVKIRSLQEVNDIDGKYMECIKKVQKLIDDEIWVNPVFENGYLYLNTNANILLHQVNKQAHLDLHIDFGQLAVRINISDGLNFSVIPYKNNLIVNGYYHPHIRTNGEICWGEAHTAATKFIAELQLDKALKLLHSLLSSYNAESPYVSLDKFKTEAQKYTRIVEEIRHPDKNKKV